MYIYIFVKSFSIFSLELNLANNQLTNIEHTAFAHLSNLTKLDLSGNRLTVISLTLSDSIQSLLLNSNELRSWPLHNLPGDLQHLQLQHNQLFTLFEQNQHWLPSRLTTVNVSHNQIVRFPSDGRFDELIELDLGYNSLYGVPEMLGEQAPSLRRLVLDGNPMTDVLFNGSMALEYLSMSNMPLLQKLTSDTMINLGNSFDYRHISIFQSVMNNSKFVIASRPDTCTQVRISHCPQLESLSPLAFGNLSLCNVRQELKT